MLLITCSMIGILKFFYDFCDLDVKTIDQKNHWKIYDRLKEEDRQISELDFGSTPDKLRREYLDMYERVQSEVKLLPGLMKGRRQIPFIRERIYSRKIIRWYRMSDTFRYRSK